MVRVRHGCDTWLGLGKSTVSRIYCSMFSIKQIEHLLVHAHVSTGHTHLDRLLVGVFNWCLLGNSSFPINFELLAVVSQLCLPVHYY